MVRQKGVQGHELWDNGGVQVGCPEGGVLLQSDVILLPCKRGCTHLQGRVRAQERRICVAGGDEENRIHGVVRVNFDLLRFAETDEVLCSNTSGGHDFEEYSEYMDFRRLGINRIKGATSRFRTGMMMVTSSA